MSIWNFNLIASKRKRERARDESIVSKRVLIDEIPIKIF
jgi:hypothetical protein